MREARTDIEVFPVAVLAAVALVVVAIPVVHVAWALHTGDPLRKLFEEDAYYVFQVARSVAHGHGVSADGIHATSGFQPLWAALLVLPFLTSSANVSLALVAVLCLALWIAGADVFSRLLTDLLPDAGISQPARRLFFAVVFLAAVPLRELYWGGLETGLYLTLLMSVVYWFIVHRRAAERSDLAFGVALGLLALARFEAVAFVIVVVAARTIVHVRGRRVRAVAIPVLVAVVMLLPWLAFCQAVIGRPIPQSGIATGGQGIYPAALGSLRTTWVELSLGVIFSWPTTPHALNHHPGLAFAILLSVAVRFGLAWAGGIRVRADMRWVVGALAATAVVVMALYSVTTAAIWFLPRYFAVVEPLQLGLTAAAILGVLRIVARYRPRATAMLLAGGTALAVAAALLIAGPLLERNDQYMAGPAAELAATRAVFRCAPVGMFESGRSGFLYGTRIVNLDGKTSAAALRATVDHRLIRWLIEQHIDVVFANRVYLSRLDRRHEPWQQHYRVAEDPRVPDHVWLVANDSVCTP